MTKKTIVAALLSCAAFATANAGGMLTNTNQNVAFDRNPARDAAIGIDGVYSNPAGVVFMPAGFHLSVNWQAAWQTRTINSTNPNFMLGEGNNDSATKTFKGAANAPFIPSIQAAYNWKNWSFQFGFAINGGGGKCEFADGLGSFESIVANKAADFVALNQLRQLSVLGVPGVANIPDAQGYSAKSYLEGNQYYFGFTLGAAYKINDHWSVYAGARVLYGSASYKARVNDIQVVTPNENLPLAKYVGDVKQSMTTAGQFAADPSNQAAMVTGLAGQLISQGMAPAEAAEVAKQKVTEGLGSLQAAGQKLNEAGEALSPYLRDGVNIQSDQTGVGVAPILGVDFKTKNFNFAAKYEFATVMSLKNKSNVAQVGLMPAINKFVDGTSVREDTPAMLALGAQWSALPNLRINAGYHLFFDQAAEKYGKAQRLLKGNTNEYLGGIEWDPVKKLTVSTGFQVTRYGNTDQFMNDMSYVVNSWSLGVGAKYQVSKKVAVQAAYFTTFYDKYTQATPDMNGTINEFTRGNNVAALGVDFSF